LLIGYFPKLSILSLKRVVFGNENEKADTKNRVANTNMHFHAALLLRIIPHSARPSSAHVPTPTHCKAFQGLHSHPQHNCREHFLLCLQKSPFPQALLAAKSSMSIGRSSLSTNHTTHEVMKEKKLKARGSTFS
jgi:hypothetical protein